MPIPLGWVCTRAGESEKRFPCNPQYTSPKSWHPWVSSWGDQLTQFNGTNIIYDGIGNPIKIGDAVDDGSEVRLSWNGRELESYTFSEMYGFDEDGNPYLDATTYSFTYNKDGIRTSKTVNGVVHEYILNGSQIVAEKWKIGSTEYLLIFLYDESGAPIGLKYRTSAYAVDQYDWFFFETNLQGDILAVYNSTGTKIGSYTYDAWGNHTYSTTSGITSLERKIVTTYNPFRYRGYYYDTETQWYYLQSRYYNPNWGRFISPDGLAYLGINSDLLGYNQYAYCANSPIVFADYNGNFLFTAIGAVVGGICGAGTALIEGKSGKEIWASAASGAVSGAITGAAADIIAVTGGTAGVVVGVYAAAGAIGGAAGSLVESAINEKDMSSSEVWTDALDSAVWGGAFGALSGVMNGPVTSMMDSAVQSASQRVLRRGVTISYAVRKMFTKELKNIGNSLAEEFLNNFTAWFSEETFKHEIEQVIK